MCAANTVGAGARLFDGVRTDVRLLLARSRGWSGQHGRAGGEAIDKHSGRFRGSARATVVYT
jgi:hypothetical protein